LLFAGALVVSAVLLEFLIRAFLPVYDPRGMLDIRYYADDGALLCPKSFVGRLWKNTGDYNVAVSINKYGFRDKKDLISSGPGDLFVLGDSYGLGWGVEEDKRYSNLLESILGLPVYNISAAAGDIDNYQQLLSYAQRQGARIANLVVSICMENDLRDYDAPKKPRHLPREGPGMKKGRKYTAIFYRRLPLIKQWLARHLATYHAFAALMHQNAALQRTAVRLGLIIDNYAALPKGTYSETILVSTSRRIMNLSEPFHSLIVIIPSRALWVGGSRNTASAMHNGLISLLKEAGAKIIDLRPFFEEGGNPLQYYFRNDGHWNELGHRKAAEAIASFLSQNRALYSLSENRYN